MYLKIGIGMLPVLTIPIFEKRIEMNDRKVHHPLLISLDCLIIKLPQKRLLIFILKKVYNHTNDRLN